MAKDEPYDMLPHKDIIELKKQIQNSKAEKFSSQGLMNSVDKLTKSMDSMLRLFKEASEDLKIDEEEDATNKKLNEIIEQNKIIAEGMVTVSDMVKDFIEKQNGTNLVSNPKPSYRPPVSDFDIQQSPPLQSPPLQSPPLQSPPLQSPPLQSPPLQSPSNQPGLPDEVPPVPPQGSVVMPSIPFSSLDEPPKPKKKGLFGKFMK